MSIYLALETGRQTAAPHSAVCRACFRTITRGEPLIGYAKFAVHVACAQPQEPSILEPHEYEPGGPRRRQRSPLEPSSFPSLLECGTIEHDECEPGSEDA